MEVKDHTTYTVEEAYELGKQQALEAAQAGDYLDQAMTWDEPELMDRNLAYDKGVLEVQQAFVLERFPTAKLECGDRGFFVSVSEHDVLTEDPLDSEQEAWEEAAAAAGRRSRDAAYMRRAA